MTHFATDESSAARDSTAHGRSVARGLVRAVNQRLRYERENKLVRRAAEEFREQTTTYVALFGALHLRVEPDAILPQGEPPTSDGLGDCSVALRLYRDGIRRLVFQPDVEPRELDAVVDVLARTVHLGGQSEDPATALWKRDLRHVDYYVIDHAELHETDEDESESPHEGLPSTMPWPTDGPAALAALEAGSWHLTPAPHAGPDAQRHAMRLAFFSRPLPGSEEVGSKAETGPGVVGKSEVSEVLDEEGSPIGDRCAERSVDSLFQITAQDRRVFERERAELVFRRCLARTSELALGLLRADEITVPPGSLASLYIEAINEHTWYGVVDEAIELLEGLGELARDPTVSAEIRAGVAEVQSHLAAPTSLDPLVELLERDAEAHLGPVLTYLEQLGQAALLAVTRLLERVEETALRRKLIEFICDGAFTGRFSAEQLLTESCEAVVTEFVDRLGRSGQQALDRLELLAAHHGSPVRAGVARALAGVRRERATRLASELAQDAALEVRVAALATLATHSTPRIFRELLARVRHVDFHHLDPEEQRALLAALVGSDPHRAGSALEAIVRESLRPWSRPSVPVRVLALQALASCGTHPARAFLRRGLRSRRPGLRQACEEAMAFLPPCAKPGMLGARLVEAGALCDDDLAWALDRQRRFRTPLGEIVVRAGLVEERTALRLIGEHLGIEHFLTAADVEDLTIPSEAFLMVPMEVAESFRICPVNFDASDGTLYVLAATPQNGARLEVARRMIQVRSVVPLLGLEPTLAAALRQFYGGDWQALQAISARLRVGSPAQDHAMRATSGLFRALRGERRTALLERELSGVST